MSDAAKNADIEDVLASIRRLVSEGERSQASQAQQGAARRAPGRLILTPAQRIQPALDPADVLPEESAAEAVDEDGEAEDWPVPPAPGFEARDAQTAEGAADEEWSLDLPGDEAPEPQPEPRAEAPAMTARRAADWGAPTPAAEAGDEDDGPRIGPELDDEDEDVPSGTRLPPPAGREDRRAEIAAQVASLEAAIARRRTQSSGEEKQEVALAPATEERRSPLRLIHDSPRADDDTQMWPGEEDEPSTPAQSELPPVVPPSDGPDPAAAAWARALAEVQSEDAPTDDMLACAALEETADAAQDSVEAALDQALSAGAIDPVVLRRMVTEIIRDELQGALGERITRNVRKLVRREIYRALSSDEIIR
ncbi:hypothetical protein ACXN5S_08715 [Pseudoroseicyclus sp. H15]